MGTGEDRRIVLPFDRGQGLGGDPEEISDFTKNSRRIPVEVFEEEDADPFPAEDFEIVLHRFVKAGRAPIIEAALESATGWQRPPPLAILLGLEGRLEIPDILMCVTQAVVMPGAHPIDRRPQQDDDTDVFSAGFEDPPGSGSGKQVEGRNFPDAGLFTRCGEERKIFSLFRDSNPIFDSKIIGVEMRLLGDPIFARFARMREVDIGMPQEGMVQRSGSTFGSSHHKEIGSAKGHLEELPPRAWQRHHSNRPAQSTLNGRQD